MVTKAAASTGRSDVSVKLERNTQHLLDRMDLDEPLLERCRIGSTRESDVTCRKARGLP
jgi:hypothetical protein